MLKEEPPRDAWLERPSWRRGRGGGEQEGFVHTSPVELGSKSLHAKMQELGLLRTQVFGTGGTGMGVLSPSIVLGFCAEPASPPNGAAAGWSGVRCCTSTRFRLCSQKGERVLGNSPAMP